jgi:GNAT superfamily N-acetyltransferase
LVGDVIALHRRPDLLDEAAVLMREAWPDHYGPAGVGCAMTDLKTRCRPEGLPFGVVALTVDGVVAGLGALDGVSYGSAPDEPLWLVGLCVRPQNRKAGVATKIVKALMHHATNAGYDAAFATTHNAVGLLTSLGWAPLRRFEDDSGQWDVLRVAL